LPAAPSDLVQPSTIRSGLMAGARAAWGVPGLVLFASMVGFGGLVRESGIDLAVGLFMTGAIWALPSQVVLAGAVAGGASLVAAALAVALSAVRLMPMTAAILPELRGSGTSRLTLAGLSHFVAVTPWIIGMTRLPSVPKPARPSWFAGGGRAQTLSNIVATAVGFWGAGALPPILAGGLVFLTPVYFLLSMAGTARTTTDRLALGMGLVATPLAGAIGVGADLMWGGLVGGTLAFVVGRMLRRWS
jgi:predicted branched-subunit amino acid permease